MQQFEVDLNPQECTQLLINVRYCSFLPSNVFLESVPSEGNQYEQPWSNFISFEMKRL
jgi:hypothetical protein